MGKFRWEFQAFQPSLFELRKHKTLSSTVGADARMRSRVSDTVELVVREIQDEETSMNLFTFVERLTTLANTYTIVGWNLRDALDPRVNQIWDGLGRRRQERDNSPRRPAVSVKAGKALVRVTARPRAGREVVLSLARR